MPIHLLASTQRAALLDDLSSAFNVRLLLQLKD